MGRSCTIQIMVALVLRAQHVAGRELHHASFSVSAVYRNKLQYYAISCVVFPSLRIGLPAPALARPPAARQRRGPQQAEPSESICSIRSKRMSRASGIAQASQREARLGLPSWQQALGFQSIKAPSAPCRNFAARLVCPRR